MFLMWFMEYKCWVRKLYNKSPLRMHQILLIFCGQCSHLSRRLIDILSSPSLRYKSCLFFFYQFPSVFSEGIYLILGSSYYYKRTHYSSSLDLLLMISNTVYNNNRGQENLLSEFILKNTWYFKGIYKIFKKKRSCRCLKGITTRIT